MSPHRRTFIVQAHLDGPMTVENVHTRERVPIGDLAEAMTRIDSWLANDGAGKAHVSSGVERRTGSGTSRDHRV